MSNGFLPGVDLYGPDAGYAVSPAAMDTAQTATKTTDEGAVKAGPVISWLLLLLLFVVFRVLYEMSGE